MDLGGVLKELWAWVAGFGASALAAAMGGRLAWHTRLAQKGERKFFSKELAYELPLVFFGFYVGAAAAKEMGFEGQSALGVVAVISYLGPGFVQWAAVKAVEWFGRGMKP